MLQQVDEELVDGGWEFGRVKRQFEQGEEFAFRSIVILSVVVGHVLALFAHLRDERGTHDEVLGHVVPDQTPSDLFEEAETVGRGFGFEKTCGVLVDGTVVVFDDGGESNGWVV